MKKTIICLGAKRSGTTAVHQIFLKHPDVGICNEDQEISNCEPTFWNFAAEALYKEKAPHSVSDSTGVELQKRFLKQIKILAADINLELPLSEKIIFDLWDIILDKYGPIVFDKSPKYLGSPLGMELLQKYMEQGNDVRIIGIIRDPRDVITSQYELWHEHVPYATPEFREKMWINYYMQFESLKKRLGEDNCPLVRYEDLANEPDKWVPFILEHCGLDSLPDYYSHIKPVSIGRYFKSNNREIKSWDISDELKNLALKYGYDLNNKRTIIDRVKNKLGLG